LRDSTNLNVYVFVRFETPEACAAVPGRLAADAAYSLDPILALILIILAHVVENICVCNYNFPPPSPEKK
jgi:hypothetical protein